jgi:hypothetical protein
LARLVTSVSTLPLRVPRRIAMLSVHTSPLDQPGTGDAGGLNVYVVEVAKRLAERGTEVEIFTRAVCRDTPPLAELVPGVLVRSVVAGPFEELDKTDLPSQVCPFTLEVLRAEAAAAEPGQYDLVHAHYWLSGKVGAAAKERWGVPLVQSMHTLGRVKNAALAAGETAEPQERIRGEHDVIAAADRLIANTAEEARQLIELYCADPASQAASSPSAPPEGDSAWPRTRWCCCSSAGCSPSRARTSRSRPPPSSSRRVPSCAARCGWCSSAGRAGGSSGPTRTGCASSPRTSGSAPTSASSRRARRPSSRSGTGPPRWSSPRPTRSRSGWWRWRRRPAAPRSWRPGSAACAPSSATAAPACWWTGTTRPTGRGWSGASSRRRGSCRPCPRARGDTRPPSAGPRPWTGWQRCIPVPWTRRLSPARPG